MKTTVSETRFGPGMALALAGLLLAGCSGKTESESIVIRGSNTVGEELAPALVAEYRKEHPGATFDLEFKGTSYGSGALMVGRCDIAAASRELSRNELELAKERSIEFNDYTLGYYSVAVVINGRNPVQDLSPDQVRDIFTGVLQNWNEVGGPDAPIQLYVRDPVSGTHLGFQELAMDRKPYALGIKTCMNNAEIVQSVARDPNGIGYTGIDLPKNAGARAVSIAGVAPTADAINKGEYPYSRVLRFYTDKSREKPAVREFIRFAQSTRGQAILDQMGFVHRAE
jgi:phosphate transport system substrate-binding protein